MKKSYRPRYQTFADMRFPGHHLVGFVWEYAGSKGDTYRVELTEQGFMCGCWGFLKYKHCKHIEDVHSKLIGE